MDILTQELLVSISIPSTTCTLPQDSMTKSSAARASDLIVCVCAASMTSPGDTKTLDFELLIWLAVPRLCKSNPRRA
jgi:hypothetical protein